MARRTIVAAALCALTAAFIPAAASAHQGNPNFESLIRSVTPKIAGFRVDVVNGDDRLAVNNHGSQSVTIYGYNDEPYLRFSPDGTVSANVRSPAYYLNRARFSGVQVPPIADEKAAPRWRVLSRTGAYEFHDHRMHWMSKTTPKQVTDKSKRTKIVDWKVPLRAGSTPGAITGVLFWRGSSSGGPPAGAFIALAVLALLGGAAVVTVRRRRQPGGQPREEAW
jgi:hypothetical protein